MLRLLFVTDTLLHGGAERHTVTLMNRLAERGHECHAVYLKDDAPNQIDRVRLRERGTVRCLHAARYLDLRALSALSAHASRLRPAALVAANPYALAYSWLALRLSRLQAPLIVTYHSTRLLGAKQRLQMLLYRPFFWTADCSVFVSANQKRYCLRRGVLARRNAVIHNGVDTNRFCDGRNPEERAAVRRALGFSDADYVIGMSAWLRPEKNHVQLVEALAMLRSAGLRARALMIGDGEMRGAVETRARELGVGGDVLITGSQEEVRPFVSACDVMVLCSFAVETFSLAALEAMAMGKPVVHADVGGASEMIFPGWNGYLFPAGDTGSLVAKLAILADRDVAASMGRHARDVVQELFSEKTMVDRYEQTLLELCRQRPGVEAAVSWQAPEG